MWSLELTKKPPNKQKNPTIPPQKALNYIGKSTPDLYSNEIHLLCILLAVFYVPISKNNFCMLFKFAGLPSKLKKKKQNYIKL